MFDSPPETEKIGTYQVTGEHVKTGEKVIVQEGNIIAFKSHKISDAMKSSMKRNWVGAGGSDPAYTEGYETIFGKKEDDTPDPEMN